LNCEITFLEPSPESHYEFKQQLVGGKLTQRVVRNLTVPVCREALPNEAASKEGCVRPLLEGIRG
jgi:hypothetical protein